MAKSESEATALFKDKLKQAMLSGNIIYVISEKEHIGFLPEGAIKILVVAELESIKERFKARMHGTLPLPVEQMLEWKNGIFDDGAYDFRFDSSKDEIEKICQKINERIS